MASNYALLIIDIQNDYCSSNGKMGQAGKKIKWLQNTAQKIDKFIPKIRKRNIPIFFIKTEVERQKLSNFEKRKQQKMNIEGICEKGSWGAEFYIIKPTKNDVVITKQNYSAFFGTNLLKKLKNQNIKNLIIIGTSTHICIDTTIRDAYQYGFNIFVIKDLVATREEEKKFHYYALELIQKQFGEVITSKKFQLYLIKILFQKIIYLLPEQ